MRRIVQRGERAIGYSGRVIVVVGRYGGRIARLCLLRIRVVTPTTRNEILPGSKWQLQQPITVKQSFTIQESLPSQFSKSLLRVYRCLLLWESQALDFQPPSHHSSQGWSKWVLSPTCLTTCILIPDIILQNITPSPILASKPTPSVFVPPALTTCIPNQDILLQIRNITLSPITISNRNTNSRNVFGEQAGKKLTQL